MKLIRSLTLGALLTGVSIAASAATWSETKVRTLQITATGNVVYVYFETPVDLDSCNSPTHGQHARGMILRETHKNFDQLYSAVLAAKHADESLTILNRGDCISDYWIDKPTVRFF